MIYNEDIPGNAQNYDQRNEFDVPFECRVNGCPVSYRFVANYQYFHQIEPIVEAIDLWGPADRHHYCYYRIQ